jgi:hypothetical protein
MAHGEPSCRRVLIPVGDGTLPLDDPSAGHFPEIDYWVRNIRAGDSRFVVLPALPEDHLGSSTRLLGSLLAPYCASFWRSDPGEITPIVLRAAGLTVNDFRAFISYRRSDGQTIADQLFDALNHLNFDVFLDRFRIDPGVHVQDRIVEELAHKSMVVLLETNDLPLSPWVAQEIAYARVNRLGLLAVNLPGAPYWPGIAARRRIRVPAVQPNGELNPTDLDGVCRRVALAHGAAMVRRRNYLRQALRDALLFHGVSRQAMASDGFLEAYPKLGAPEPYRVWLTSRQADVFDFQTAEVKGRPKPLVVGPAALLTGMRQAAMRWVADVAHVRYVDESDIPSLAADMAGGVL